MQSEKRNQINRLLDPSYMLNSRPGYVNTFYFSSVYNQVYYRYSKPYNFIIDSSFIFEGCILYFLCRLCMFIFIFR